MNDFYVCMSSAVIILFVVSHALYSILLNNKKALSSSGDIVKNVLSGSNKHSRTLKYVKREMFRRQIACAFEAFFGFVALIAVVAVVGVSCYKFM